MELKLKESDFIEDINGTYHMVESIWDVIDLYESGILNDDGIGKYGLTAIYD